MRTRFFQTDGGSEHQRFWAQLREITDEIYPTDDPEEAIFSDDEMYMIDDSPEVIAKIQILLDEWGFSK
jgi:hypothetical protein